MKQRKSMSKKTNKNETEFGDEWLNYEQMTSEIKLYHDNAISRMKEHEDKFDKLSIPHLYHVAEYYEALGIAVVCNCLLTYCPDFTFTEEEIKKIRREHDRLFHQNTE